MYYIVRWFDPFHNDEGEKICQDRREAIDLVQFLTDEGMLSVYMFSEEELSLHDADMY
jgi:hypothetical protein